MSDKIKMTLAQFKLIMGGAVGYADSRPPNSPNNMEDEFLWCEVEIAYREGALQALNMLEEYIELPELKKNSND